MRDEDLKPVLDTLQTIGGEGRIGYFYQDNATPPNVTIGVGCLIANENDARDLPMVFAVSGQPADRASIGAEWQRVHHMAGGMLARAYKGSLLLPEPEIDQLGFRRLRWFIEHLPGVFPGFDGFPVCVQQRLIDLAWNNGLGAEATATHPATGLRGWTHLRAACNQVPPDWAAAVEHCTTANPDNRPARAARNTWRRAGFEQALNASRVA